MCGQKSLCECICACVCARSILRNVHKFTKCGVGLLVWKGNTTNHSPNTAHIVSSYCSSCYIASSSLTSSPNTQASLTTLTQHITQLISHLHKSLSCNIHLPIHCTPPHSPPTLTSPAATPPPRTSSRYSAHALSLTQNTCLTTLVQQPHSAVKHPLHNTPSAACLSLTRPPPPPWLLAHDTN